MYRLAERTALPSGDDVAFLHIESGGAVHGNVCVALLESLELLDEVEVSPADHNGTRHLVLGEAHALQDTSADAHVSGERALLIDISAVLGVL